LGGSGPDGAAWREGGGATWGSLAAGGAGGRRCTGLGGAGGRRGARGSVAGGGRRGAAGLGGAVKDPANRNVPGREAPRSASSSMGFRAKCAVGKKRSGAQALYPPL
jgi:hypothetical protein